MYSKRLGRSRLNKILTNRSPLLYIEITLKFSLPNEDDRQSMKTCRAKVNKSNASRAFLKNVRIGGHVGLAFPGLTFQGPQTSDYQSTISFPANTSFFSKF